MEKNNFNCIYESFENYVKEKIESSSGSEKILNKGKEIITTILSSPEEEKNFLMVGKIQSGKTINFISVIANAILNKIKFFIILTATDNKLNEQTLKRVKECLDFEKNRNYLKILHIKEACSGKEKINDIFKDLNEDNVYIITSLKNNKIKTFCDLLKENINRLQNLNVLIIDDEGDLASMSHSIKKTSKTFDNISELKKITNGYYLSVTATPQVHLITNEKKFLYPNFAFCIEPGEGYFGLKNFNENIQKYNVLLPNMNSKRWYTEEIFSESILYYLITVSWCLKNNIFDRTTHSNMLIHTDKKNVKHFEYKQQVDELLNYFKKIFDRDKNDISYNEFIRKMNKISNKYELNIIFDDSFLNSFKYSLKNIKVIEINQINNSEINDNFCNVVIGSTLVERGITFDNLIVTFFTNRAKDKSAIDTLLQRARWFGYRDDILKFIKIYTTEKISDDFKEIADHDQETWEMLKNGEKNKIPFRDLHINNSIKTCSKDLSLTNKAPYITTSSNERYFYNSIVNDIYSMNMQDNRLIKILKESDNYFLCSHTNMSKYKFKYLKLSNFNNLFQFIDRKIFARLINVSDSSLNDIEKQIEKFNKEDIFVVLIDNLSLNKKDLKPRERQCSLHDDTYKIDQIFQGENILKATEESFYVGDRYWNKLPEMNNKIFVQIHYISPTFSNENIVEFPEIFAVVLLLPDWINKQNIFTHSSILVKDN